MNLEGRLTHRLWHRDGGNHDQKNDTTALLIPAESGQDETFMDMSQSFKQVWLVF